MKTKLLLALFLTFSFIEITFSQEYHPLLNNTSWIVTNTVSCCRPTIVKIISEGTDVVIGDYTYKQFVDPFPQAVNSIAQPTVTLREDVAAQKVYKYVNGGEVLLYDYSMNDGDTIFQYGFNWTATIDYILVNNGSRKRITLRSVESVYGNHHVKQIWIEGVGTNKHPFYPTHNMYSFLSASGGIMIYTACNFQDGEQTYGDPQYCSEMLATANENYAEQDVVFSPNPFTTELTLNSGIALQNATLKLYNTQGQLVREVSNIAGKNLIIQRENLARGLYLAQLFEKGQLVKTEKLMVD